MFLAQLGRRVHVRQGIVSWTMVFTSSHHRDKSSRIQAYVNPLPFLRSLRTIINGIDGPQRLRSELEILGVI